MINAEYEYIALHRDVGETELKQASSYPPLDDGARVDLPLELYREGRSGKEGTWFMWTAQP